MSEEIRNILILSAQVPFTKGGAELLIEGLQRELIARGFCVDTVALPFGAEPKRRLLREIAMWRALDLSTFAGRKVDLVIGTKFPTYLVRHPNKVAWLIHQHRQIYELYGSRFGDFQTSATDEALRKMVLSADSLALNECRTLCTISENVSARLERYLNIPSTPLHPPLPLGDRYYRGERQNYILSVGRLCSIKRVDLIIRAMAKVNLDVTLRIVGMADEPAIDTYLRSEIEKHHLWDRITFLGRVDDQTLLDQYAQAFAVFYAPYDEDYGFVTLEALASGCPVITATDSGTVLEFVRHEDNGLVVVPDEIAIAEACNRLFADTKLYARVTNGSGQAPVANWDEVVQALTGGTQAGERTWATQASSR